MPLHTLLLNQIRKTGLTNRELTQLCLDNAYKISNAERRLREMRNPLHRNYDPNLKVEIKDGTIMRYFYEAKTLFDYKFN